MSDSFAARPSGLSWREVGEEVVVLDLESSQYYSFNASGAVLWRELADRGASTVASLAARLVAAYDIGEDQAGEDAAEFVAHCRDCGLLA